VAGDTMTESGSALFLSIRRTVSAWLKLRYYQVKLAKSVNTVAFVIRSKSKNRRGSVHA
jgi:hypothetical protein